MENAEWKTVWCPYFRPTRHRHDDSGYLVFEVGYTDGERYVPFVFGADTLILYPLLDLEAGAQWRLHIDMEKYGYMRIFGNVLLKWHHPILSSAMLEEGSPDPGMIEARWAEFNRDKEKKK